MTFLTPALAARVRDEFGTPTYVYDRATLEASAKSALAIPAPYGLTVRYAMKANPNLGILRLFRGLGLHIDASSDHEVQRALRAGFAPDSIQLTSQYPSARLAEWVALGMRFNACSLHQLAIYGRANPGGTVSVRINPGLGSGGTKRTRRETLEAEQFSPEIIKSFRLKIPATPLERKKLTFST
jgi:diaminopimelate decarboxylase